MERNKETENKEQSKEIRPDNETLHNTDPQDNMKGPVSSSTRGTGEAFDTDENKKDADERREEKM